MPTKNQNLWLSKRTKVRCTKCHVRLLDRGQMADGTWMIHLKKQQMNVYIPFWLVIECNNCGSIYKVDADKGIVEKYLNSYLQEKDGTGNQEQNSDTELATVGS